MYCSNKKAQALQNKFKGSMHSGGAFWGQVSYVRTRFFTGMMYIFGTCDDDTCRVQLHNRDRVLEVTDEIADILLSSTECPICDMDGGQHKMDCSRREL